MRLHANAALSLSKRRLLCQRVLKQDWTLTKAAETAEVSVRCARKWVGRYRAEGELGLLDRPSTPARIANRTDERRIQAIALALVTATLAQRGLVRRNVADGDSLTDQVLRERPAQSAGTFDADAGDGSQRVDPGQRRGRQEHDCARRENRVSRYGFSRSDCPHRRRPCRAIHMKNVMPYTHSWVTK